MSDAVQVAALALVGTIFSGVMTYLAVKVGRTDRKLDASLVINRATHKLVNSNMAVQLLVNVLASERLARLTGNPEDERASIEARRLLDEHRARQAIVDADER